MHHFHSSFGTRFRFTPWTFSSRSPMTDVEYADDTVIISRTQLTLHRLLHSLQHESSKRGLLLNPVKCQLLRLHSNLPIHLSPHVTPLSSCSSLHCMGTDDFGVASPPLQSAKYLGAYVAANASSEPHCNIRKQWARFAPFFPSWQIRPSLPAANCRCMRKLCLPSYYMGVNLKSLPLRRS